MQSTRPNNTNRSFNLSSSEIELTLKLLYQLIYFEPTETLISRIHTSGILQFWLEYLGETQKSWPDFLAQDDSLEQLQADHLALFVGLGMPLAPPWASVYLNEENLLLGPSTYKWMVFLKKHKLECTLVEKQPQDHIGLMLSVIATLLPKANAEHEINQHAYHRAINIVLSEHLLVWQKRFCELLIQHAQTPFYRLVGIILDSVLVELTHARSVKPQQAKLYF